MIKRMLKTSRRLVKFSAKASLALSMVLMVLAVQAVNLQAYEGHIIAVSARISDDLLDVSIKGGNFCLNNSQNITLSSKMGATADIYYTTNGSDPVCGQNGIKYVAPFSIASSTVMKVRVCYQEVQSAIFEWNFNFSQQYCGAVCGDGIVNQVGEECDGSAGVPAGKTCTAQCHLTNSPVCGDGVVNQVSEKCDDNNLISGDGCSATCQEEAGSGVKINKVFYKPDCSHGHDVINEWIELYNPTNKDVDIRDWKIVDNNGKTPIEKDAIVPANGFLVITPQATTWEYWTIPGDVLKLELGRNFGNGLDNNADMLVLENEFGVIIDQMNWGTANATWTNSNSGLWPNGAVNVASGHLLGRVPNGYSTNNPSDFKELTLPTVKVITPNTNLVWHIGATEEIVYEAKNKNGADSELSIDIYFSGDSGQTWGNIARNLANTGHYNWRVPLALENNTYSTISSRGRIKVVAHGPENPMLIAWDMSDQDFCPPLELNLLTDEEVKLALDFELINQQAYNDEMARRHPAAQTLSVSTGATQSSENIVVETVTGTSTASSSDLTADSASSATSSDKVKTEKTETAPASGQDGQNTGDNKQPANRESAVKESDEEDDGAAGDKENDDNKTSDTEVKSATSTQASVTVVTEQAAAAESSVAENAN